MQVSKVFFKSLLSIIFSQFFVNSWIFSGLNFVNKSSTINVQPNAQITFNNPVSNIIGTITKNPGATIYGNNLSFSSGLMKDTDNEITFLGVLDWSPNNDMFLNGNTSCDVYKGRIYQSINVSNKNNKLRGAFITTKDITLLDANTSLSVNTLSIVDNNIILNNGSLYLDKNNLQFSDDNRIYGPGNVYGSDCKIIFGTQAITWSDPCCFINSGDIEFNQIVTLNSIWTFSQSSILNLNGNILFLDNNAKIKLERGASLMIKNAVIHGLGSGNIFCMDNNGTITFQNSHAFLTSDYTFSMGKIDFIGDNGLANNYKFTYRSTKQSTILSAASLTLDVNVTFSYDPGSARTDLIYFQDNLAILNMNGATLHATLTGMQLSHGQLIVTKASRISSEKTRNVNSGITFGNNFSSDDFICQILNGTTLELTAGSIKYKNVNPTSWFMENPYSLLQVDGNCNFYLYQSLNFDPGVFNFKNQSSLFNVPGATLTGSLVANGFINYAVLTS
jgi:hypothetical protein